MSERSDRRERRQIKGREREREKKKCDRDDVSESKRDSQRDREKHIIHNANTKVWATVTDHASRSI